MKDKLYIPEHSEAKHKKKSTAKGRARADHKHEYETVLLKRTYTTKDMWGKDDISEISLPTKLCTICGRIKETDTDDSYYVIERITGHGFIRSLYNRGLSEKALNLPKWYADFWDAFAKREENC